ncbi:hypothetical protein B0H15DRAFT_144299 [Mycena belliarum]|uniref:Uncharacterized protein n=1 Tax=Mycena belliarum TaxID=1033014 RepID=A0AAD6UAR3_9AGAR|nr:hypothetical protein B0H15DRAFT_144299 [Mycena belliae]
MLETRAGSLIALVGAVVRASSGMRAQGGESEAGTVRGVCVGGAHPVSAPRSSGTAIASGRGIGSRGRAGAQTPPRSKGRDRAPRVPAAWRTIGRLLPPRLDSTPTAQRRGRVAPIAVRSAVSALGAQGEGAHRARFRCGMEAGKAARSWAQAGPGANGERERRERNTASGTYTTAAQSRAPLCVPHASAIGATRASAGRGAEHRSVRRISAVFWSAGSAAEAQTEGSSGEEQRSRRGRSLWRRLEGTAPRLESSRASQRGVRRTAASRVAFGTS